jgi:hypothetical protein
VPVSATRYLGTICDFVTLNAPAAVDQAADLLRTAFAR